MSKELELFIYEMPDDFLLDEEVYYMYFPKQLIEFVKKKQQEKKFKFPFRLSTLNNKVKSLFPQIISLQINEAIKNEEPWIIAKQEVPSDQLKYIYKEYFKLIYDELRDKVTGQDFIWKKGKIKEIKGDPFQWIPAITAHGLAERVDHLTLGDRTIPLTLYPITFNGVSECISEPVRHTEKDDYFSYVLRFKLVTRGGEGIQRLSVSTGIRRYIQKPYSKKRKLFQSYKKFGSVLLGVKNPFTNRGDISFSQLRVKYAHPNEGKFSKWESGEERLFSDVLFGKEIHSDQIFEDPLHYLEGRDELRAFIVYSYQIYTDKYSPKVKSGMGLEERSTLFNLIQEKFPELIRVPKSIFIKKISKEKGENERLPLISPANISKVVLEVWGSVELYEKVIGVLLRKEIDGKPLVFREGDSFLLQATSRVEIEIVHKDPEGIIHELENEKYGDKALQAYVSNISSTIEKENSNNQILLGLVEIDKLNGETYDHKQGTRIGLARVGRISQFIHPLEGKSADEERILNGFIDLLSDAGFLRNNWSVFESNSTIMSLSLIKNKKVYIPVITRIIEQNVELKIYGIDEWLSPSQALTSAEKAKGVFNDKYGETINKDRLRRFLVENIKDTLNRADQRLYLLLDATLRHGWMNQITNSNLNIDTVPYLDNLLKRDARIKVIRINTTDEIPQYRIIKNEDEQGVNKESGLFRDPKGIYYSVGLRPSTWKKQRNQFTKYDQPNVQLLQQRAVEIIPLGLSDENERDEAAHLVYRLRKMNLTYEKHTEQPYPIHKASAIRKYIEDNVTIDFVEEFEDDVLI